MDHPSEQSEPTASGLSGQELAADEDDGICEACAGTSWQELADGDFRRHFTKIRFVAESHEELQTSQCKICRLISLIKPPDLDSKTCWLSAISSLSQEVISNGTLETNPEWKDCTYLAMKLDDWQADHNRWALEQHLAVLKDGLEDYTGTRRIQPMAVDYDFIQRSLQACVKGHESCRDTGTADIPGLRVLDCRTRSVLPAPPGCEYVALSYVWGSPEENPPVLERTYFPAVIEDSIQVTLALGHQYLWVDRLCILEDDAHKAKMIQSMDLVYSEAFLTIIAAAGEDAHYGLPGVGNIPRQQNAVRIGDVRIVERLNPHPATLLKASKWSGRGWTCQEGFLSRRRLVFTDQQAFYVCREFFVVESVQRPKIYEFALDEVPMKLVDSLVPSFSQRLNHRTKETNMYLKAHLEEYTKRSLRYEGDILRAFLGILAYYIKKGVYHIWGLPVARFGYAKSGTVLQMDWYHHETAKRRVEFPSWSWVGWHGAIRWTSDAYRYHDGCQIEVIQTRGDPVPIARLKWSKINANEGVYAVPQRLAITSKVMPLVFRTIHQEQAPKRWARRSTSPHYNVYDSGVFALFPWTEDIVLGALPFFDHEVQLEDGMLGLILHMLDRECKHRKGAFGSTFTILMLQPIADYYERIGLMTLDINEAPVYLDGSGQVLEGQPNMLETPSWDDALWYKNSDVRTIHLV